MTTLEKRLQHLEARLIGPDGPSFEARLREALHDAAARQRRGLPVPALPQGEDPLCARVCWAKGRAASQLERLQAGLPVE